VRRACLVLLAAVVCAGAPAPAQEAAPQTLDTLLAGRGWVGVQLRENAFSQLEADVVLNGEHTLRAQISTSFSKTILDRETAEKLGLEIERTQIEITAAAGKQRLGSIALQTLAFAEASVGPCTVFTAELDKLTSRAGDAEPYHMVIGSDFLTRYQAILEIPTSRLYLRVN